MTEQTQRDHDEAAHERLAAIRSTLGCAVGEEAIAVRRLDDNAADLERGIAQLIAAVHALRAVIRRDIEGVGIVCTEGEEVAKVAHLAEQYRLCRERLDQIEREAADSAEWSESMTTECCDDLKDALFNLREWLLWKLDTAASHVPGDSPSGHPHGWCAIQIPDWDVKQHIEILGRYKERT